AGPLAPQQGGDAYVSLDGQLIRGGAAAGGVGDSDDPTNTAMFLDESEENELVDMAPGTPQAFKKLGQVTVKSISRQRDSQTPGRTIQRSAEGGSARYNNAESPSKKGRGSHTALLSSRIPAPPTARAAGRRLDEANDGVPLSVRKIRSSQRAANILDRIKHAPSDAKSNGKESAAGSIVDGVLLLDSRAPDRPCGTALQPSLAPREGPKFALPRPPELEDEASRVGDLREKLLEIQQQQQQQQQQHTARTSPGDVPHNGKHTTPYRELTRIEGMRQFFSQPHHEAAAGAASEAATGTVRRNGNLLISFDAPDRQECDGSAPLSLQLSQVSSIPNVDEAVDLLQSPSPSPQARDMEGVPRSLRLVPEWDSGSPLLLSFTSRFQEHDMGGPVPFVLNSAGAPGLCDLDTDEPADLIGLSSRLNASICALNHGLREHMVGNAATQTGGDVMGAAADAMERVGAELNQSLVSLAPRARNVVGGSPGTASASPSEIEGQLETLRKTMEDT
ncbi:hypothetical protein H4R21_005147, partial [Coemansia helicoidea]